MRPSWFVLLALYAVACGVQQVELAPSHGEVIVLDGVPRDALARLQEGSKKDEKPGPMLTLRYPADATAIPENLAPIDFLFGGDKKPMDMMMMKAPAGFRAYELCLTGMSSELCLYTTEAHAELPSARWRTLLARERHGELTVAVRALADDERVLASHPIKLRVLGPTRAGSVTYWNDTLGTALRTQLEGEESEAAHVADYPTLDPWQSLSEDGSRLALAQDGSLSVSVSGTPLDLEWAKALQVDFPSWSPEPFALLFVQATALPSAPGMMMPMMMPEMAMPKSALLQARMTSATTFAEPEVLLSAEPDELLRAPSYSHDGRFIAFERAKGKDKLATLWVMSAAGGEARPIASKLAWKGEGAVPTWLPARDADGYWLVFSQGQTPGEAKLPADQLQLWVVALELGNRSTPEAVSEPFWLPSQGPDESSRRALFVAP